MNLPETQALSEEQKKVLCLPFDHDLRSRINANWHIAKPQIKDDFFTQAQRDLLEAEVGLLQTMLDYESALVNFEAVQQAPPLAAGDTVGVRGANVVQPSIPEPRGIFRPGSSSGF